MSRDTDRTESLRCELVRAIVEDTGLSEPLALPFANSVLKYLQREHAGERLYIPAPARQYDELQIRAGLERGDSVHRVCTTYSISRSMLYKLFPDGLPRKRASAA